MGKVAMQGWQRDRSLISGYRTKEELVNKKWGKGVMVDDWTMRPPRHWLYRPEHCHPRTVGELVALSGLYPGVCDDGLVPGDECVCVCVWRWRWQWWRWPFMAWESWRTKESVMDDCWNVAVMPDKISLEHTHVACIGSRRINRTCCCVCVRVCMLCVFLFMCESKIWMFM